MDFIKRLHLRFRRRYFRFFLHQKSSTVKAESILQADVLDIIFENRNKDFGAYPLRKYYHYRLLASLGIIIILMSLVSIFILVNKPAGNLEMIVDDIFVGKVVDIPAQPVTPPAPPVPQHRSQQTTTAKPRTVNVASSEGPPIISSQAPQLINFGNRLGPAAGPEDSGDVTIPTTSAPPIAGNAGTANVPEVLVLLPSYPGGLGALKKFLENNLVNPEDMSAGESTTVKVRFIVGFDGKLKSFDFVESAGQAFNNEVIRVLKKMPDWMPGRSNGKNVSTYYVMPVKFVAAD